MDVQDANVAGPAPWLGPSPLLTTIRWYEGIRTVVFMHADDMRDRGLAEFDPVDITCFSPNGIRRTVYGYRAMRYEIARGCAAGYSPELSVLAQPTTVHVARNRWLSWILEPTPFPGVRFHDLRTGGPVLVEPGDRVLFGQSRDLGLAQADPVDEQENEFGR